MELVNLEGLKIELDYDLGLWSQGMEAEGGRRRWETGGRRAP